MTSEQITAIKVMTRLINIDMPKRHRSEESSARAHLDRLQSQCDHKNPDGTSAIDETGMFYRSCIICHWNDM